MKTKPSRNITSKQKDHFRPRRDVKQPKGFALVVTLSLMILLTVIAVGLLSLSSITLRTSSQSQSLAEARANAKLAVMMALSALQTEAGDDRRITADAGILDAQQQPVQIGRDVQNQYAVAGVWNSWSPDVADRPMDSENRNIDYAGEKGNNFRRWLVSTKDPADARDQNWYRTRVPNPEVNGPQVANNWPLLFSKVQNNQPSNRFQIHAEPVPLVNSAGVIQGRLAYAVVQENTKAKINIGGPDQLANLNDALMAQPRPSLENFEGFNQPNANFNLLASRVLSLSQLSIEDPVIGGFRGLAFPANPNEARYHLTTDSRGLLTDVVDGGLKVDLSLGFEMPEVNFNAESWNDFDNPFRDDVSGYPKSYNTQVPLYRPNSDDGGTTISVAFGVANRNVNFPGNAVATFDTLRSHYRSPLHLYGGTGSPTAFARRGIHPAVKEGFNDMQIGFQKAVRPLQPVLDRLVMTMNVQIDREGKCCLVLNPTVVIWNPYNVAIESPGLVVSQLMDFPFKIEGWQIVGRSTGPGIAGRRNFRFEGQGYLSRHLQPNPQITTDGRSNWPYYYFYLSNNGNRDNPDPIRLAPGELRAFTLQNSSVQSFDRLSSIPARTYDMVPVTDSSNLNFNGGIGVRLHAANSVSGTEGFDRLGGPYTWQEGDTFKGIFRYLPNEYEHFIVMEDGRNFDYNNALNPKKNIISEMHFTAPAGGKFPPRDDLPVRIDTPEILSPNEPITLAKVTFYRRTAQSGTSNSGLQTGDLLFTTNPRSAFPNPILSNFDRSPTGPQYDMFYEPNPSGASAPLPLSKEGLAYSGETHAPNQGRTSLPFFEVPQSPLLSLAGFQHADISTSAFSTAYQIGNSWAMPYMDRARAMTQIDGGHSIPLVRSGTSINLVNNFPVADFSYLANEALWDKYFFSGAASTISPASTGDENAWSREIGNVTKPYTDVLEDFIKDPFESPLRNSSMILHTGGKSKEQLISELTQPEGCVKIAGHLMVDGAFNVNSLSVGAWTAILSGLQEVDFAVDNGPPPSDGLSYFSRMSRPRNEANDLWEGYRGLTGPEVQELALEIVREVQKRGPFLSLGEFVNRQLSGSQEGLAGAIQAAIANTNINQAIQFKEIDQTIYSEEGRNNIVAPNNDTGVAIPGYLTQADVLNSIGPRLTARSDTFTIRGYGDSYDTVNNRVKARVVIEAVVQRVPEFVDSIDEAYTPLGELQSNANKKFGRRFEIVSYRELAPEEL